MASRLIQVMRAVLGGMIALIYSGAERYFAGSSTLLHYGFEAALLIVAVCALLASKSIGKSIGLLSLYWLWLMIYIFWGLLVTPDSHLIFFEAARVLILNVLLFIGIASAVTDSASAANLAGWIQISVIGNALLSVVELSQPHLIATLAHTLNPDTIAYNVDRPAGLWVSPNEAGIAFVFALFISTWAPKQIAWPGRAAALIGVYLTGSRGAIYPLIVCLAALMVLKVVRMSRRRREGRGLAFATLVGAGVALLALVALPYAIGALVNDPSTAYALNRFLDLTQASDPNYSSRATVAGIWIANALRGPLVGSGLFSFQGSDIQGAHDIYIAVWGEAGIVIALAYVLVLGIGFRAAITGPRQLANRQVLILMWCVYLFEGLVWHNQFTSVLGIIIIVLLYKLPAAVEDAPGKEWPRYQEPQATWESWEPETSRSISLHEGLLWK